MDSTLFSGIVGLMGATIGGTASFATSWLTLRAQLTSKRRDDARTKREQLFSDFITEASRVYGDALGHHKDDVSSLVSLYALLGRIRLAASPEVVSAAERVLDIIIETYLGPVRTLHELRTLAKAGGIDVLGGYGEACRRELDRM